MKKNIFILLGVIFQICLTLQQDIRTDKIQPKIIGGKPVTDFHNVKHMVSIRLKSLEKDGVFGKGHICGGALIKSHVVLTAAHCFLGVASHNKIKMRDASEFTVVMGTLDKTKKTSLTFQSNVKKIIPHRQFKLTTLENDIGVMILEKDVPEKSSFILPIPISNRTYVPGTSCNVIGWGTMTMNTQNLPNILRSVNITIINQQKCKETYQNSLQNGMFCAGNWDGGQDSCQGDSGGPLTTNGILIGIVSWGDGCGKWRSPGIYSDVHYYNNWIKTNSANINSCHIFIIISTMIATLNAYL